jgi:hypothetical protein
MGAFFFSVAIIELSILTGSVINSDSDAVIEPKNTPDRRSLRTG